MASDRQKALDRLNGLKPRVEEHLAKIAADPTNRAISHWKHEVYNWLRLMEASVAHVGKKTGDKWTKQIELWRSQLGVQAHG
jgi:hypothetical protein